MADRPGSTSFAHGDRHIALIVEDDSHIAAILKELVVSLGHAWRHAVTLEEARAEIAAGGFCYVLLDMQIPADADSSPAVGCGETILRLLRRLYPGRVGSEGNHILQILVVTSYSREHDFVSKVYEMGANGFIPKPFGDRPDLVLDKIRGALGHAGREEHDACLALQSSPPARPSSAPPTRPMSPPVAGAVQIVVDGSGTAGRSVVFVNGLRVSLQDSYFGVFVSLLASHLKAPESWCTPEKLGISSRNWAVSRVRAAFKEVMPEGFEIVETRKGTGFRLNRAVAVEKVEWGALVDHSVAAVRKVAGEWTRGA